MLKFESHIAKAHSKLTKHGVSFEVAASVFGDMLALTFPTPITPSVSNAGLLSVSPMRTGCALSPTPSGADPSAS